MDKYSVMFGIMIGMITAFFMQLVDELTEYFKDKNKQRRLQKKEGD